MNKNQSFKNQVNTTEENLVEGNKVIKIPVRKHIKFKLKKKTIKKLKFEPIEDENGFI